MGTAWFDQSLQCWHENVRLILRIFAKKFHCLGERTRKAFHFAFANILVKMSLIFAHICFTKIYLFQLYRGGQVLYMENQCLYLVGYLSGRSALQPNPHKKHVLKGNYTNRYLYWWCTGDTLHKKKFLTLKG